jgi:hypothetical protein
MSQRYELSDFWPVYEELMHNIPNSDLKTACHYWMLKKYQGLHTDSIEEAVEECAGLE